MNAREMKIQRLAQIVIQHASDQGMNTTAIKDLITFKSSQNTQRNPVVYEPAIIVGVQGRKRCHVGDHTFEYATGEIMILFLSTPLEVEILDTSEEKPYLCMGIAIDLNRFADIILKMERMGDRPIRLSDPDPSGVFTAPLSDALLDAILRLFDLIDNPLDASMLSQPIMDEIYYRLLRDERGGELKTLLQQRGQIQQISKAVAYIHENLDEVISIDDLADLVHMSASGFHKNFKKVMHISPLQYTKSIKLHKAQTFIHEGITVGEAAYRVGYNSPAQFSREYKRHFGFAPSQT